MKLTKIKRHKYYKEALKRFIASPDAGICYYLSEVTGDTGWEEQNNILSKFPEFKKKKPSDIADDLHWWYFNANGNMERIKALRKCIKETA